MRYSANVILGTLVFIIVVFSSIVNATMPISHIVYYKLKPLSRYEATVPNLLEYTFTVNRKYITGDKLHMELTTWGGIEYIGTSEMEFNLDSNGACIVIIDVIIPDQDTSGINIKLSGMNVESSRNIPTKVEHSFVTTTDTLEIVDADMRYCKQPKSLTMEQMDSISIANATHNPDIRTLGKDIPPEGLSSGGKLTKEEIKRSKKRIREQYPLTDKEYEEIWIEDTIYYRYKGETKFQYKMAIPKDSLFSYFQKRRDSIQANTPTYISEYVFDLRKPEDYDMAREIFDELIETDSAGFYRVKDQHTKIKELGKKGIEGWPIRNWPPGKRTEPVAKPRKDTVSATSVDSESEGDEKIRGKPASNIFCDDFESGLDYWDVYDGYPFSGDDNYWGLIDDYFYVCNGSYSVWCAGSKGTSVTSYENDMCAVMEPVYSFDISNYYDIYLYFSLYLDTEDDNDYFYVTYSTDGFNWTLLEEYDGYSD